MSTSRRHAPRKTGLTADRHAQIGTDLKNAHHLIVGAVVAFANAYPKNDPLVRELEKALRSLDDVRSDAEDRLYREHPDEATTNHYYGIPTIERTR